MNTECNSCFYSFKKTVILSGNVVDRVLHLNSINVFFNRDCETIVSKLKLLKNVWIAPHTGLEACLNDIRFDIASPTADLIDIWQGLKSKNKVVKHFENTLSADEEIIAIQILLKALTKDLFQQQYTGSLISGTIVKHQYHQQMSFGRSRIIYGYPPR